MINAGYINAVCGMGSLIAQRSFCCQIIPKNNGRGEHYVFTCHQIRSKGKTDRIHCYRKIPMRVVHFSVRKYGRVFRQGKHQLKISAAVQHFIADFTPRKTVVVFVQVMVAGAVAEKGRFP